MLRGCFPSTSFGSNLDVTEVFGFAICGAYKVWRWAKATLQGKDAIEVWNDDVAKPVVVRYAWADNPVCNVISTEGLPLTPFRTNNFDAASDKKNPANRAGSCKLTLRWT